MQQNGWQEGRCPADAHPALGQENICGKEFLTGPMNNYMKIAVMFLLFAFLPLSKAHAADIALGVYPPVIQIYAQAPTEIHSPITLSNLSDQPLQVKILVRPFTAALSDNGIPAYLPTAQHTGDDPNIFQKMSIFDGQKNTDEVDLAPNQKRNIELRVNLPQGEPPSDYYFSLTFLSNPASIGGSSNTAVAGGVSSNVLLSIGPYDKTTGYVDDFSAPLLVEHGPVAFSVQVNNTSKHFISPQGTILIKNMYGQTIGKVNLLPVNILVHSSRYLPSDINSNTKAIWGEQFLLGPYSATLTLALSSEGPIFRRTIYFFAMPIQALVGLLIAAGLVAIIVYKVKKRLS